MHCLLSCALLACAAAVHAFSDSSPLVILSTSNLPSPRTTAQLQTSAQALSAVDALLASCPTSRYVLVSQPGLHAGDIRPAGGDDAACGMPHLCRAVAGARGSFSVAEVVGTVAAKPLRESILAACAARGRAAKVEDVEMKTLPGMEEKERGRRAEVLADNDYELGQLLDTLGTDYTVVLFADPHEFEAYEPSFVEPVHMDLKRQADAVFVGRRADNGTRLPLFEKYQFFTPGLFEALLALIIFLSMLTVGLRALSSLQVSYGAFEKDMGPAAQKKQQ